MTQDYKQNKGIPPPQMQIKNSCDFPIHFHLRAPDNLNKLYKTIQLSRDTMMMTKTTITLITNIFFTISLLNTPSYAVEVTPSQSAGVEASSAQNQDANLTTTNDNSASGKLSAENTNVSSVNAQTPNVSTSPTQITGFNQSVSDKDSLEKKYQDYVNKFDSLQKITEANIEILNKKLESIYLADKKIGGTDGPGYYYRFKNDSKSLLLDKGFYYVYTKKGNSDANLLKGMLVNFSLSEKRPSGKTLSQATNISLAYNDDLPSIAKLVFTVAKPGDSIKVVTLAEYIYPTKDLLPSGIAPDDTLIYNFDINRQYEK